MYDVVLPHVITADAREALLIDAFYTHERRLYYAITREGAPGVFASLCCKTLFDFGCLPGYIHALSALLNALRPLCGESQRAEIESLARALNGLCAEAKAPGAELPLPPAAHYTQTVATPIPERSATVFVSYSHYNAETAQRVMTDLRAAGYACWIDTSSIKGGDEWARAISEGINNSYALAVLCSRQALRSRWVWKEITWAEQKGKRIIPVLIEDVLNDDDFFGLHIYQAVALHRDYADGMRRLRECLPRPQAGAREGAPVAKGMELREPIRSPANRRKQELEYLDNLRLRELLHIEKYTPLAGTSQVTGRPSPARRLEPAVMRPEFELRPWSKDRELVKETRRFENAVDELLAIRRAVVLGEPGAGKTTTLWALARRLVDQALADPGAPIPLLIRLGNWTQPDQPLRAFLADEVGNLGAWLAPLLARLNEMPAAQREAKSRQVQAFIGHHPGLMAIVTAASRTTRSVWASTGSTSCRSTHNGLASSWRAILPTGADCTFNVWLKKP